MQTEHIRMYLAFNYSDSQLAALLCHAESGKLGWNSCCCLVGIPTAPHPLQASSWEILRQNIPGDEHLGEALRLPFAIEAYSEFYHLGSSDKERRELLIPLIHAEMERREKAREQLIAAETAQVG